MCRWKCSTALVYEWIVVAAEVRRTSSSRIRRMSVFTENSFLCDHINPQTTTNARSGRRASGFVQVGLSPAIHFDAKRQYVHLAGLGEGEVFTSVGWRYQPDLDLHYR